MRIGTQMLFIWVVLLGHQLSAWFAKHGQYQQRRKNGHCKLKSRWRVVLAFFRRLVVCVFFLPVKGGQGKG